MKRIVSTYTVAQKGIGSPDYSREIHKIKRGELYYDFAPRPDIEKYKIFYAMFVPGAELGVGETVRYLDVETDLPMPWTHEAGFISDFREWMFNLDGRVGFMCTMDDIPFYLVPETLAMVHEYEKVVWFKTSLIDPDSLLPHTWDVTITNLDDHPITGTAHIALVVTQSEGS